MALFRSRGLIGNAFYALIGLGVLGWAGYVLLTGNWPESMEENRPLLAVPAIFGLAVLVPSVVFLVRGTPREREEGDEDEFGAADFVRFVRENREELGLGPARTADKSGAVAAAAIEPGWYATDDGAHQRWHDGQDWTEQVRPTPGV